MPKKRVTSAVLVLVAMLVLLLVGALSGCQSADNATTTVTTATGETGGTATTGSTETTGTGGTATTGSQETTSTEGGQESVAPVSDNFKICTQCHGDFNAFLATSKVLTKNFSHALHLNKGYKCEDCHVVPTHQPDAIVPPPMLKCFQCHGQEADALAPGACGVCHPKDFPLVPANHNQEKWMAPTVANASGPPTVDSNHSKEAQKDPEYCAMCHAQSFCDGCHKTAMPHPADWQQAHPQAVKSGGQASCARCHPAKLLCNNCHHPGYKTGSSWTQQHPPIVKSKGAENCFKCHNPLDCAHCHITGNFQDTEGPSG